MSQGKSNKGGSLILPCICRSAYQDGRYGDDKRDGARCTVCGTDRSVPTTTTKEGP